MTKHEQAYTTKFVRAIKDKKIPFDKKSAGPIEVKMARGLRIYRKQFAEHQIHALRAARLGTLAWKIPDAGFTNPFDIMLYCKSPAWALVVFDETRFYLIDAIVFFDECEVSLVEAQCSALSFLAGEL